MRLLLDTHVLLWWLASGSAITKSARSAIRTADVVFVSAASAWEASIKAALGRLRLPEPVSDAVTKCSFQKLPISFAHAEAAAALPLHHQDPFDRVLIAQARLENLVLVTHDRQLNAYDVEILWT